MMCLNDKADDFLVLILSQFANGMFFSKQPQNNQKLTIFRKHFKKTLSPKTRENKEFLASDLQKC